jgi:tetratricopeptide (TPR) repeat protein
VSDDALARVDARRAAGDDAGALALAEAAVAAGSTRLALHFRLASLLLRAGRYREADAATTRAARLAPAAPAELVELGKRLAYFNRGEVLRDVAAARLRAPLWHAGAEADFAALLSMLGEQDLAFALVERAARQGVDPAMLYNRSQLHLYAGRLDAAEADLRHALRLAPGMAKARWALSKLPGPRADPAAVAPLATLADAVAPSTPEAPYLLYALFNHLDALDRVDEAWSALSRACAAKRRQLDYAPARSAELFAALGAIAPPPARPAAALPTSALPASASAPADGAPTPVFIVGMHRSGTTLLERMLGNHPEVREGGELYDFPAALRLALGRHFAGPTDAEVARRAGELDFPAIGREYLQRVGWRADGRRFLVDKLPSNFLNAAFILRALPGARVLHMRRGAMDTCFSNLKELFSNACPYSYDQVELADWYAGYRGLMAGWAAQAPGAVLDVDYEALARDPRGEGERVLAFCGLPWDAACLDVGGSARSVNTASSAQVREPIHTRGIGAWRRYEAWLQPLAARLAGERPAV